MKMKKYFACLIITLSFSFSVPASEDQIVNTGNAVQFGIWKVYNSGDNIYFIDQEDDRFVVNGIFTDPSEFHTKEHYIRITRSGSSSFPDATLSSADNIAINDADEVEIKGQLKDGRYRLGDKLYVVSHDTVFIFVKGDEDAFGKVRVGAVLKKFSNEMVFNGTKTSTVIDPTVRLDPNDIPTAAKILGDCLATYSPETGRVEIPCLKVKGGTTIYNVGQQQIPDTLTFDAEVS